MLAVGFPLLGIIGSYHPAFKTLSVLGSYKIFPIPFTNSYRTIKSCSCTTSILTMAALKFAEPLSIGREKDSLTHNDMAKPLIVYKSPSNKERDPLYEDIKYSAFQKEKIGRFFKERYSNIIEVQGDSSCITQTLIIDLSRRFILNIMSWDINEGKNIIIAVIRPIPNLDLNNLFNYDIREINDRDCVGVNNWIKRVTNVDIAKDINNLHNLSYEKVLEIFYSIILDQNEGE